MTHSIYRDSVIRSARRGPPTVTTPDPRPVDPDPLDAELIDILDAQPRASETIEHVYRRKERELAERFAALSIVAAMTLHKRLASPRPDDALAQRFDRLVVERRARLLSFLGDARRRAALTGRR